MRTALALFVLCLVLPASALAGSSEVIRDCTDDGVLQKHYSQKELAAALAALPSDVSEYTNCGDVIRAAQRSGASGSSGSSGGGGVTGGGGGGVTGGAGGGVTGGGTGVPGAGTPATVLKPKPKGTTAGEFGGFSGYDRNPARSAAAAEKRDISSIVNGRGPGDTGNGGLPVPIAIALALVAAAVLALGGLELRRRRVGPPRLSA